MKEFWTQLSPARKAGLAGGAIAIAALTVTLGYWALSVDYVPVVTHASAERLAISVREIEKLKVPYRVSEDGTSLEVPANQVGRVRMGVANNNVGGPSVGFEIFNSTDFSTTEFTQKVNYQRALQGELSRTIASMEGVTGARVHLVLAESGFLHRAPVSPTAAITVGVQPGMQLGAEQVKGIQRLVAASVPEIKLKDIAVLDQAGEVLTKNSTGADNEPASKQLELKREVDNYLETKLKHLLNNLDPNSEFSVSVDAALNTDEVKVTTEDVLPAADDGKNARAGGLPVRERQSQRQESQAAEGIGNAASGPSSGSVTREVEYRVGHRVEQIASVPGNIERISVAVVARVAGNDLSEQRIKDLVAHAIGMTDERGDSVAVVFLPVEATPHPAAAGAGKVIPGSLIAPHAPEATSKRLVGVIAALCLLALAGLVVMILRRPSETGRAHGGQEPSDKELDQIVDQVRSWLEDGTRHAAS